MFKTINAKELKGMMDSGEEFVLVNVLDKGSFENERICGSINIPVAEIQDAIQRIKRNETVVVHCSGMECKASEFAAKELEKLRFRDVRRFEGGLDEWKKAGLCLEGRLYEKAA